MTPLQRAMELLSLGQLNEAAEALEAILYQQPDDFEALLAMSELCLRLERPDSAASFAARARHCRPRAPQPQLLEVLALEQSEGPVAALAALSALVEAFPRWSEAALEASRLFLEAGELQMAIRESERAIALEPEQPRGHFLRARAYRKAGGVAEAIAALEAALERAPSALELYLEQADLLTEIGEFEVAIQCLQEAHRCCATEAVELSSRLSGLHALKGDWAQVEVQAQKLTRQLPHAAGAWCQLATAQWLQSRVEAAEASLLRAVELEPGHGPSLSLLARLYEAAGLLEQSEAAYRQALQAQPEAWAAHNDLGHFLLALGDESAEDYLQRARDLAPHQPAPLLNLAILAKRRHQPQRLADCIRELEAMEPLPQSILEQLEKL